MSSFTSIKEAVCNTTTNVLDFTRGVGSNLVDVTTDNRVRVIEAAKTATEIGKANRIKSQTKKAMKKLAKLQKEQAELEAKFLFEQPESNHHDNTAE